MPSRKHPRLQEYDYSQNGAYFVTVCAKNKRCLLGTIKKHETTNALVQLSPSGKIVDAAISEIPAHYTDVLVERYIVMPNHIHLVLLFAISDAESKRPQSSLPVADALLPVIIAALKKVTNKAAGLDLWQTSYHDHVIRNEEDYFRIANYIDTNPLRWAEDVYHPEQKSA